MRSKKSTEQPMSWSRAIFLLFFTLLFCWIGFIISHLISFHQTYNSLFLTLPPKLIELENKVIQKLRQGGSKLQTPPDSQIIDQKQEILDRIDDSYHIVFSTGCSEFQDWQSIGVYSSAIAVGQRGYITRIASGCKPKQEEAIRHAMSHLPKNCRIHFAPNTQVRDHYGNVYKYANKPLGMMHWLTYSDPPIPPTATIALIDPDFFFLRPLWHDSFDNPSKYFASGKSVHTPMPPRITKGVMVSQRYGIGGTPWRIGPGRNGQKAWDLKGYLISVGRSNSPALAPDLNEQSADTYYSFGAPYIAIAEDWLPIATNWTNLMPMAVERNFGNLAEMYACSIAVADYGIRPVLIDSLMVSNVEASGEGWPWIDKLPIDRGCDPTVLTQKTPEYPLPTFLHYCQGYWLKEFKGVKSNSGTIPNAQYSKYQVPDEILQCPKGSKALEGGESKMNDKSDKKRKSGGMVLNEEGFLPEPPNSIDAKGSLIELRHIFSNCVATRATNQAARDFRKWFCEVSHNH